MSAYRSGFSAACAAARGRSASSLPKSRPTSIVWLLAMVRAVRNCLPSTGGGQDNKKERLDRRTTTTKETIELLQEKADSIARDEKMHFAQDERMASGRGGRPAEVVRGPV